MIAMLRAELVKQARGRSTYAVLGACVLITTLAAVALRLNAPTLGERDDSFSYLATLSGVMMPVAALRFMSRFLLVVVVAIFAGRAVASDARWGNLGSVLTRPIGRRRVLVAKAEASAMLVVAAIALTVVTGLVAGVVLFGWQPLDLAPFRQTTAQMLGNLGLGSAYVLWSMATVGSFSFMVSTMTDFPAGAVLAGVGLHVAGLVVDGIRSLGSVRSALPIHFADAWTTLFVDPHQGPTAEMLHGALLQIPYLLVFAGVAWWRFRRADIDS